MNVMNNVYRYQSGFSNLGPEQDPSRQFAQMENYGQNLQKGSQKFLPKLPSPAFADIISPVSNLGSSFVSNDNDYVINKTRKNNNANLKNYDNEFNINEPIAVHVHNAHDQHTSSAPIHNIDDNLSLNNGDRETVGNHEMSSTPLLKEFSRDRHNYNGNRMTTVEQFSPTQPTTFENTRNYETTFRNQHQNTFNPNPITIGKHNLIWFSISFLLNFLPFLRRS